MNSTGKIITALAAGAALGLVAGILFAPDKGSETRKKLKAKGKKFKESVTEKFEDMAKAAKEKAEEFA